MKPPDDTITVHFRPLPDPDGVPLACRVKAMLKHAKRACFLENVGLEGNALSDPPAATPQPPALPTPLMYH